MVGFIGAGNMAEALMRGILKTGIVSPQDIVIADIDQNRITCLQEKYSVQVAQNNRDLVSRAEIVILSVKPQVISDVLKEITSSVEQRTLLISIAAGITLSFLKAHLPHNVRIVRVMPNTPALVLEGMTAICSDGVNEEDMKRAEQIFSAVGRVVIIRETLIDAVTGLSGSGPAYVAVLVEALTDGGVLMGLPRNVSQNLALQTVLGSVRLLMDSQEHPAHLKDRVSSPGGTTIHGIYALEKGGFRASLIEAVRSATIRSQELGDEHSHGKVKA